MYTSNEKTNQIPIGLKKKKDNNNIYMLLCYVALQRRPLELFLMITSYTRIYTFILFRKMNTTEACLLVTQKTTKFS